MAAPPALTFVLTGADGSGAWLAGRLVFASRTPQDLLHRRWDTNRASPVVHPDVSAAFAKLRAIISVPCAD